MATYLSEGAKALMKALDSNLNDDNWWVFELQYVDVRKDAVQTILPQSTTTTTCVNSDCGPTILVLFTPTLVASRW